MRPALFFGEMKQVQSLEVVPLWLQAEAKQASGFWLSGRSGVRRCGGRRRCCRLFGEAEKLGRRERHGCLRRCSAPEGFGGAAGLGGAGFSGLIPPSAKVRVEIHRKSPPLPFFFKICRSLVRGFTGPDDIIPGMGLWDRSGSRDRII